ncbi:MAG: hypothetical protein QM765_23170 [Myxococcales bacterium]
MAVKCRACEELPSPILAPQVCPPHRLGLVGAGGVKWPAWAGCRLPRGALVPVLLGPFEGEVGRCWLSSAGGGGFGMHREVLASRSYFEFCIQHVQGLKDVAEALTVAAGDSALKSLSDLTRVVEGVQGVSRESAWAHLSRWAYERRLGQSAAGQKVTPGTLEGLCHQIEEQLAGWRPTPEDLVETAREVVFGAA